MVSLPARFLLDSQPESCQRGEICKKIQGCAPLDLGSLVGGRGSRPLKMSRAAPCLLVPCSLSLHSLRWVAPNVRVVSLLSSTGNVTDLILTKADVLTVKYS